MKMENKCKKNFIYNILLSKIDTNSKYEQKSILMILK